MIDIEDERKARRQLTDALHAMHPDQSIIVSEELANRLNEAWDNYDRTLTSLQRELVGILAEHVAEHGESEGAVEVLQRLLLEHDCPRARDGR